MTRLALSSPVAATTTSQVASWASSREETSQASAWTHSAPGTERVRTLRASFSMSMTVCPLPRSSPAIDRPTAPAPTMATLMIGSLVPYASAVPSLGGPLDDVVHPRGQLVGDGDDELIAVLQDGAGSGQLGLTEAPQRGGRGPGGGLEVGGLPAAPPLGDRDAHNQRLPGGLPPQLADLDREQF